MGISRVIHTLRGKLKSRSGLVRSVGVLIGGTAFAQALTILALPLITRLYSPTDFSMLAVYASILGIISVSACLRLEIAIPMPERDEDAANLLALSLFSCTVIAGTTALAVWLYSTEIVELLRQPYLKSYLWLLPLGIWFTSAYSAMQFWSTRKKKFGIIARTRMGQAVGGIGTQIGVGWTSSSPFGLLLGHTVASGAGLIGLAQNAWRDNRAALQSISWAGMRTTLGKYQQYPKFSTLESLSNSASIQLPIIIIAAVAIGQEAGYLMLATRVMAAPMALIGGAVSQVYLSKAPEEMRAGRLASFTMQIICGLVKAGVGPLLFAGILAPTVFPLLFGEKWHRAGDLVAWMTPWFIMQFLASPVSMTLHVTGNQRTAFLLQFFGLLLRVGTVMGAYYITRTNIAEAYSISGFIFYAVYFYVVLSLSAIKILDLWKALSRSYLPILFWLTSAIVTSFIIDIIFY